MMMFRLCALALAAATFGCGDHKPPVTPPTPPGPAPITAAPDGGDPDDCDPDVPEDVPDDLHDRIAFLDEKTELWGYKTKTGKIALPARYDSVTAFGTGGVAAVLLDDKTSQNPWRFIDPSGKVLATPFMFDNGPDYWQGGLARIVDDRGKFGFISTTGAIVVPPTYDFAYAFCRGIAKTALDGKAGYIDTTGKPAPAPARDSRPLIPRSKHD